MSTFGSMESSTKGSVVLETVNMETIIADHNYTLNLNDLLVCFAR